MKKLILPPLILLILLIWSNPLQAQSYIAKDGTAEFISNAPMLEFKGTSNNLTGLINLDKNLVDFYLDLTTLDTGIDLRNQHMRDSYLETDEYPFAEFTGQIVSEFDPDLSEKQEAKVKGTFKIHGVEREITVPGTITPTPDGLQLDASWTVLLNDYNIERPGVVFYKLADEQKVNISILLTPKEE
jgi:polyisoprenoid-binding protein YceI